ncbi:hypothetical protein MAP00_001029 [Monascus purpureus]|nr:hypothetical protein MAP00_001029 [Monascus purpureus]
MIYTPSASPKIPHRPRLPPMHQAPKVGPVGRWYLPAMAVVALGFGVTNYVQAQKERRLAELFAEEERIKRNQQLMDAYGDKSSLKDVEHALEMVSFYWDLLS